MLPARIHVVMVVCHGNICRSPFAEHTLRRLRPDLEIVSSGLRAGSGDPADPTAVRAAQRFGVDLREHSSRPLSGEGVAQADLILAMEGHHVGQIARHWPEARRRTLMLGAFLAAAPYTLEDPWGESDAVFTGVFRRIDEASRILAAQLAVSEA